MNFEPSDKPCYCTGPQNGQPKCPCQMMKSGFFDLPVTRTCTHREHNPPTHMYIPPGQGYRHVCPGCGYAVELYGSQVWCGSSQGGLGVVFL